MAAELRLIQTSGQCPNSNNRPAIFLNTSPTVISEITSFGNEWTGLNPSWLSVIVGGVVTNYMALLTSTMRLMSVPCLSKQQAMSCLSRCYFQPCDQLYPSKCLRQLGSPRSTSTDPRHLTGTITLNAAGLIQAVSPMTEL
jgi:hypothetical protein